MESTQLPTGYELAPKLLKLRVRLGAGLRRDENSESPASVVAGGDAHIERTIIN